MSYTRLEFVEKYGGYISNAVKGTGLLQGTVIAQGIIESQGRVADGSNEVGASKLARNSNNFFGIKCHNWGGKGYNIDTGEVAKDGSLYVDKNACFRKYDSVEDSIDDYVKFLKDNPRYENAGVFQAQTVREQAEALKRAGYATNPDYPSMIEGVYNGVKDYADKFNTYGIEGVTKSFINSPTGFLKRNKYIIGVSVTLLIGSGVGTYYLLKK